MVLDATMALVVLSLATLGFVRGFIKEVFGIAGMVIAIVLTASYSDYFSEIYGARVHSEILAGVLSGVTVFVGVMTCVVLVNGVVVRLLSPLRHNALDKTAGLIVGVAKGLVVAYCAFFIMETFLYAFAPRSTEEDAEVTLPAWFANTYSYNFFSAASEYMGGVIPELAYDRIGVVARELLGKGQGNDFEYDDGEQP
ncbi:putative membrane protein [Anaplasma centrale str. Israel]|uniref:Putative membrane protein n=1 Tax=Anaplasma centrale (strain Israel) TaxID=574556 RepID=D1ASY1_ANACI|nr:CvpA family protein [Anaplasma centrale]ACZ49584.1 putative membrane protein [Anaplasma centrale str. Israel]